MSSSQKSSEETKMQFRHILTALKDQSDCIKETNTLFHELDKKVGILADHDKGQNGRLEKNEIEIEAVKKTANKNKLELVKWVAGISSAGVAAQVGVNVFF